MGRKGKSTLVSSNNRSSSKSVGVALQPVKTLSNEIVAPADENCMTQSVVTGTKKKRVTILEDSTANGRDDAACVTLDSNSSLFDATNAQHEIPSWLNLGKAYQGYCPFRSSSALEEDSVPRIPYTSLTPKEFYDRFVVTRRPCILTAIPAELVSQPGLRDFLPLFTKWTDDDYLIKAAGWTMVDVEYRDPADPEDRFGQGRRTQMPFSDVVEHIRQGGEKYYITTQKTGSFELGGSILTLTSLVQDYPSVPSILRTLVPFQYNMWFGNTKKKTSTGLHHDFHDNFYIMIRGRKKFRLFSPRCAEGLGVSKPIVRIHPNGLIAYDSVTRSDGCNALVVTKWRLQQSRQEVKVLQSRLSTLEHACKVLRFSIRHVKKRSVVKRPLSSKIHKRSSSKGLSSSAQPYDTKLCNIKLAGVVSQGFVKELTKRKPKKARSLLKQELQSRMESIKLMNVYIEEATDRLLDLELQYQEAKLRYQQPETKLENGEAEGNLVDNAAPEQEDNDMDDMDAEALTAHSSNGSGFDSSVPSNIAAHASELNKETCLSLEALEASLRPEEKKRLKELRAQLLDNKAVKAVDSHLFSDNALSEGQNDDVAVFSEQSTDDDDDDDILMGDAQQDDPDDAEHPAHFCRTNTVRRPSALGPVLLGQFPKEENNCVASDQASTYSSDSLFCSKSLLQSYVEVALNPGDMLYLPASWFHEVFSTAESTPLVSKKNKKAKKSSSGHLAFNYWFYPPYVAPSVNDDAPPGSVCKGAFDSPYEDAFCRKRYQRMEMVLMQLRDAIF